MTQPSERGLLVAVPPATKGSIASRCRAGDRGDSHANGISTSQVIHANADIRRAQPHDAARQERRGGAEQVLPGL